MDIPQLAHICLLEMRFYWTRIMLVHFQILCSCSGCIKTDREWGSKNSDMVGITYKTNFLASYRKALPVLSQVLG